MDSQKTKKQTIWIMPYFLKKKALKEATLSKKIIKSKIYDLQDFIKQYKGSYDPFTLYAIMKEEKVSPSLGNIYLSYLSDIEEKEYIYPKLQYLQTVKNKIEKKLFRKNTFIEETLKNKEVFVYGYPVLSLKERKFLEELSQKYTVHLKEIPMINHEIFYQKYKTTEEEISSVAQQILLLLKEGTPIETIKLYLPNSSYQKEINQIFSLFQIPFELHEEKSISAYDMTQYFLSLLSHTDVKEALEIVRETYDLTDSFLHKLYETLLHIITPFLEIPREDQIPLFSYLFQNKTIAKKEYTNCIEEIQSLEEGDNCIVFGMGIAMGSFPKIHKEDDFLGEEEKKILHIESAKEQNQIEKEKAFYQTQIPTKLYLTYAEKSPFKEYAQSSLIAFLQEKEILIEENKSYTFISNTYNTYLLSREMDTFRKYGEKSKLLQKLEPITYQSKPYDHTYHPVEEKKLHTYLNNSLILSYSSIDLYYRCPFRFYLSHILKIKEKVETNSTLIGNIVHKVLYLLLEEKREVEEIIDTVFKEFYKEEITPKEEFYKEKYRKEIRKLVCILQSQRERSAFREKYLEEEFTIELGEKIKVLVKGYIDKVLTYTDETGTYALIVDYKTGTIETNFNAVIHGLNMQLLFYYYLLKQRHPTYELGGAYWQNIMKEVLPAEKGKTYDRILEEAYQLNGYTRKDTRMVKWLDFDIEKSFVKSLKQKKDGEFYSYSKVLTNEEIDTLLDLTTSKIKEAIQEIEKGNFAIHPKRIGYEKAKDCSGCRYCPYQDICFKEASDIQRVKEYKNLEFLKEASHE